MGKKSGPVWQKWLKRLFGLIALCALLTVCFAVALTILHGIETESGRV